jgi:hypothetical protein
MQPYAERHSRRSATRPRVMHYLLLGLTGCFFVDPDKLSEGRREQKNFFRTEGVDTKSLFEPDDHYSKREGIQAGIEKFEIVGKRRQVLFMFISNTLKFGLDCVS